MLQLLTVQYPVHSVQLEDGLILLVLARYQEPPDVKIVYLLVTLCQLLVHILIKDVTPVMLEVLMLDVETQLVVNVCQEHPVTADQQINVTLTLPDFILDLGLDNKVHVPMELSTTCQVRQIVLDVLLEHTLWEQLFTPVLLYALSVLQDNIKMDLVQRHVRIAQSVRFHQLPGFLLVLPVLMVDIHLLKEIRCVVCVLLVRIVYPAPLTHVQMDNTV
jgi:hypothetical protein